MPPQTFEITAPNGRTLEITGDRVPTEAELQDIFAKAGVNSAPAGGGMNFAVVNGQRVPVDDTESDGPGAFATHFAQQVNPLPVGQLLPFPQSLGGAGMDAPLKAAKAVLQAQGHLFDQAKASYEKGDYVSAAAHTLNWLLPVIGPVLDKAGTELKSGRGWAGAGDTLGLATSLFGPQAVGAARGSAPAQRLADVAETGATRRAVETLAPNVGPNKVRIGNDLARVAPEVLRNTSAVTRGGMLDQAAAKLDNAYAALDAAYDAVPNTRMYPTAPIKAGLQREISKLSVSGIGGVVEPANRASRIASLRQAMTEVKQMGNLANIDNLRKLRIAWDEGAKAQFTPSVSADYLKARGQGAGWADARSVLSDYVVSQHPELEPLNADATVWKKAVDAMQAAEENERVRPKVGRTIFARAAGAAAGGDAYGAKGVIAGGIIGPLVERIISNATPAAKIFTARQLTLLSDALRSGQTARAQSLVGNLRALAQQLVVKAGQTAAAATSTPVAVPAAAETSAP